MKEWAYDRSASATTDIRLVIIGHTEQCLIKSLLLQNNFKYNGEDHLSFYKDTAKCAHLKAYDDAIECDRGN